MSTRVKITKEPDDPLCLRASIGGWAGQGYYLVYRGRAELIVPMLERVLEALKTGEQWADFGVGARRYAQKDVEAARQEQQELEDAQVVKDLPQIAGMIKSRLPYGWGFVVLAFPFGPGGRMNYVANADRPDVVRAMYEFIEATKEQWGEHEPPLGAAAQDTELGRARQRIAELERENEKLRKK